MIAIINGPNLNLLGRREPEIYGTISFEDFLRKLRNVFADEPIEYFQSNCEGELIDKLHSFGYDYPDCKGIVLNPGAYAHYSYALADAVRAIPVPVVEVHMTNIEAREEFRRKSVTAAECKGMVCGLGLWGYETAISYLLRV